jgi:hypothetical protein
MVMRINSWKLNPWTVGITALVFFAAGSLITSRLTHVNQLSAQSRRRASRLSCCAGKLSALESRFCDTTSKLLAKHDLKVVGDWVPEGAPD